MVEWILTIYDSIMEFIGISFAFALACAVAFGSGYYLGVEHGEQSVAQVVYIPEPKKAHKPVLNTRQVKTENVK